MLFWFNHLKRIILLWISNISNSNMLFPWCSGYHIRLTRGRSPVRSRAETNVLHWLLAVSRGVHASILISVEFLMGKSARLAVLQQILQSGTGFLSGTCVSNGSDKLCTQWSDTSGDGNDFDQFLTSDMASKQPQNGLKGKTWPWNWYL